MQTRNRTFTLILALMLLLSFAAIAPAAGAQTVAAQIVSPEVIHTGAAPTGYEVTFRYYDPTATTMRIKGEWSFSSAADIAAAPTNPNPRYGSTWQVGDFPLTSPNTGSAGNWPVNDMVKDAATGVWSFTTKLPSGVFTYAFYKDCAAAAPALTGCVALADPLNPPWDASGSIERNSQVYVPADPAFGTDDLAWQGPAPAPARGTLTHVTYSVPGHTNPTDQNYLTVYLPADYNPQRAQPYPIFYLIHGGGGNEMDWSTQGAAANILDNLIAARQIQPMVVVMPNNPATGEILNNMIPYVEQHYNVIAGPAGRALAGLSGGATSVQDILFHYTASIGHYAVWSAPRGLPTAGEEKNPQLKELLGLHIAVAIQDLGGLAQGNTTAEQALLTAAGVPFVSYNVNGGHNWAYWRLALRDFLGRVAFKHTTTTLALPAGAGDRGLFDITVTVKADTTEPATPSGTVQFYVDGQKLDTPRPVRDGVAKLLIARARLSAGEHTVTAVYSGDHFYNTSAGTLVVTR